MKRNAIFILIAAAGLMAVGCTKEYYTRQVTEQTIIQQGTVIEMKDATVKSSDWMNKGDHFEALIEVDKITKKIVDEGTVQVNRKLMDDANKVFWVPLPAMRVEVTEAEGGGDFFYTTFTDFEWTEGFVSIYVTTTDLDTGTNPGDMSFRIIIQI